MKHSLSLLSVFLLFCTTQSFAQLDEKSDYEIQQSFKAEYEEFQEKIDTVSISDSARAITEDIEAFDETYSPHEELLDKALYPNTYEQQIAELRKASESTANRLAKMEEQDEQLTTLEIRLLAYQEHVHQLTQQADSLKKAMEESIQSERQLSGMVQNYRQNLEERDELILAFIDSTVVAYEQMDLEALAQLEELNKKRRLDDNGDVLTLLRDISAENVNILEENTSRLYLEDYMRMYEVQQRFDRMWSQLGDKITEVYGGDNAETLSQEVNNNLQEWEQLLQENTLASMQDSLREKGINIDGLNNKSEFYASLNSYLDSAIQRSKEGASQTDYEHYRSFQDFWNPIERRWSSNFVNADFMTDDQMMTISEKTDTWSRHAEPESNTMLYLFIGTGIIALILGGFLIREKRSKKG
ncbi:hypothetical protein LQ318_03155 [Aliifodinibius salicampi]|uniref:LPXTG-motif cell wall anchor domain-containing protein n=1 Tax=Fodinibius salicampi TaxID=1920655 RepID=A0ABT3PVM2_9BACT|nr:hypothetical protein [Fodinibius salicampi]MCW9711893.1 hypothetical protein [Fodinibius salicampi]